MKLVIFDMDGTMLDTESIAANAVREACKTMGYVLPQEVIEYCMGRNQATTRGILLDFFGADFDVDRSFELYMANKQAYFDAHGIQTKAGLYEILDKLEALGIKKCVATSTDRAQALKKLETVNIAHRFSAIIGGDEIENGKPAPDIFLKAAAVCQTDPADCTVIEDTEAGILAATAANIPVIVVPDVAPLSEEIRAKAFAVCADLNEVADMIALQI
ncbi:MAG: HAD family phosphatase [Defluviitaleaceae bacterium]|nr:HAD family phosphatase [Defluviitaleaceae bacterium]